MNAEKKKKGQVRFLGEWDYQRENEANHLPPSLSLVLQNENERGVKCVCERACVRVLLFLTRVDECARACDVNVAEV